MTVAIMVFAGVIVGAVGLAVLVAVIAVGWLVGVKVVAASQRWLAWRRLARATRRQRVELRRSTGKRLANMRTRDYR